MREIILMILWRKALNGVSISSHEFVKLEFFYSSVSDVIPECIIHFSLVFLCVFLLILWKKII